MKLCSLSRPKVKSVGTATNVEIASRDTTKQNKCTTWPVFSISTRTQLKTEEKIGKDIPFVKLQLADNQVRPTPLKMFIFWDLSSNPGSVFFSDPETVGGRGDV